MPERRLTHQIKKYKPNRKRRLSGNKQAGGKHPNTLKLIRLSLDNEEEEERYRSPEF